MLLRFGLTERNRRKLEQSVQTAKSDFELCKIDMEQNYCRSAITTNQLLFAAILLISSVRLVQGGCRMQDRNPCETVCQWNATRNDYECVLRVIVILPKKDSVEASLQRVINKMHLSLHISFKL